MKRFFLLLLSAGIIWTLCACADGQPVGSHSVADSSSAGAEQLTQAQLDWFQNTFFNGANSAPDNQGNPSHSKFLTSLYDSPEEIDLFELLYCGTGQNEDVTKKEAAALSNMGVWSDCDCTKNSTANIDSFLEKNTGLTLGETNKTGLEWLTYLPDYDAYYFYHGDSNALFPVIDGGWTNADGTVSLTYDPQTGLGNYRCVTLAPQGDDTYWFVSNMEVFKPGSAVPETPVQMNYSDLYDSHSAVVSCEAVTDAAWMAIAQDVEKNYPVKSIVREELTDLAYLGQVKAKDGGALDVYQADYALLPTDLESVTPPSGAEIHCGRITGSWTLAFGADGQAATVWTPSLNDNWESIAKQLS